MPGLPTRLRDWRLVSRSVRLVLGIPTYLFVAVVSAVLALSVFVWSRNLTLLLDVVVFGSVSLGSRLAVLVGLYPFLGTGYNLVQSVVIVGSSILVGVNVALISYHVRAIGFEVRSGSGGFLGVVLGTLGAGCAACGSALLAGVLSLLGAGGVLALLPLDGLEFSLAAVGVMVVSLYWIAEGMRGSEVRGCPVDPPSG